jgi:hypothetical protein
MKIIEHDPTERPAKKRYSLGWWWMAVWAFMGVIWLLQWRTGFDWDQLALGFGTGLMFGYMVIDVHLRSGGSVNDL